MAPGPACPLPRPHPPPTCKTASLWSLLMSGVCVPRSHTQKEAVDVLLLFLDAAEYAPCPLTG